MKKLNTTYAIAILALGFTLVVVAAGCGGNDTTESALTKNAALSAPSPAAKAGSSDSGAGGSSPTVAASAAGSSDSGAGGTSSTVAASAAGSSDGAAGGSSPPVTASAAGSSDSGAGGSSPTVTASAAGSSDSGAGKSATGSADGGTGKSATVDKQKLRDDISARTYVASLTNAQLKNFDSDDWLISMPYLSASQVASISTKSIKDLSTGFLTSISKTLTQALTTEQLNSMSEAQLDALFDTGELTETQLLTVNKKLAQLNK